MSAKPSRPTAPHLQVYRLPLTGLISISHRITGVFLLIGLLAVVLLLSILGKNEADFNAIQSVSQHWLIKLGYWAFVYALFFHVCHGLRHLLWDLGLGFDRLALTRYAVIELVASILLTLLTYWGL